MINRRYVVSSLPNRQIADTVDTIVREAVAGFIAEQGLDGVGFDIIGGWMARDCSEGAPKEELRRFPMAANRAVRKAGCPI